MLGVKEAVCHRLRRRCAGGEGGGVLWVKEAVCCG